MLSWLYRTHCYHTINDSWAKKKKKILLFPEMRVTRKIFTRAPADFFFINFPKILSFLQFLLFFCILVFFSFFFFVFACVIFKIKNKYSDTHSIMRWVSNKKKFTRPIFGNKTTFFWPYEIRRKEGDTEFDDFII